MKKFNCANCDKGLGEMTKGKVHREIRYICQPCLDKLFRSNTPNASNDDSRLKGFKDIFEM